MINSLKIENFKGFRELELPQLTRIMLLGGKNNVVKTSLLEAICAFFQPLRSTDNDAPAVAAWRKFVADHTQNVVDADFS